MMIYINPGLLLEMLHKKHTVRFTDPIVYSSKLEQSILSLTDAIFCGQDESLCTELLLKLADRLDGSEISTTRRENNVLVQRAKEIIYCNLEKSLKLDEICKEFDMSKFQFIREFKAGTGISPYKFFLNSKVERAKQLIEKSRDVYLAVAECGFVDLTHLNRHFKSIYGTTAFEYMSYLS